MCQYKSVCTAMKAQRHKGIQCHWLVWLYARSIPKSETKLLNKQQTNKQKMVFVMLIDWVVIFRGRRIRCWVFRKMV